MKKRISKRTVCLTLTAMSGLLLIFYELFGREPLKELAEDETVGMLWDMLITRATASIAFLAILVYLGYRVLNPIQKPMGRSILFSLPALIVVVNNLPIYPLWTGMAKVTSPMPVVLLLAVESLMIGLFEETCFRGVILLGFLEKRRGSIGGRFWSIVLTSAVFGGIHLINLLFGSSPLAVLMQIGYSFLIGAMCSVILMKTANIWFCILLHSVFDFCGNLVPLCGEGVIWEPFTITVTVVIAVIVTGILTVTFFQLKRDELDRIYEKNSE